MVEAQSPGHFVEGEVFLVTPETLVVLDHYEDLASGEYRRAARCVFDVRGNSHRVQAYIYQWPSSALPSIGRRWTIDRESTTPARHP